MASHKTFNHNIARLRETLGDLNAFLKLRTIEADRYALATIAISRFHDHRVDDTIKSVFCIFINHWNSVFLAKCFEGLFVFGYFNLLGCSIERKAQSLAQLYCNTGIEIIIGSKDPVDSFVPC